MSNLAALAHVGDAKAPQFNAIFYATIATIIPVLFVAAALQADQYAKLIEISQAAHRRFQASHALREETSTYIIFLMTFGIPALILCSGVISEIVALLNLYLQRTIALPGPFLSGALAPFVAAVSLTVAAAMGPAAKFGTLIHEVFGPSRPGKSAENPSGEEPHGHGTATGEPSPPEGGKPGTDPNLQKASPNVLKEIQAAARRPLIGRHAGGRCKNPGWAQIRGWPAECTCPPLQHQA